MNVTFSRFSRDECAIHQAGAVWAYSAKGKIAVTSGALGAAPLVRRPLGSRCGAPWARGAAPPGLAVRRPLGSRCGAPLARGAAPLWLAVRRPFGSRCGAPWLDHAGL